MNNVGKHGKKQADAGAGPETSQVRKFAIDLYYCLILDTWPSPAVSMDFGVLSQDHYGALQYAVRDHGVTPEDLDRALGNGAAITALIRQGNPYLGIRFTTPWDNLMPLELGEEEGDKQTGGTEARDGAATDDD